MVMSASFDPRLWSASVMGGKTAGVSGPGVGSDATAVQAGGVGTTMFVGKIKLPAGVDGLGDPQAVAIRRIKHT